MSDQEKPSAISSDATSPEPDLMERTRAAVTFLNSQNDEEMNLWGFLSLFHPEMSNEEKRRFIRATRE